MKRRPLAACFLLMVLWIVLVQGRTGKADALPEDLEGKIITLQGTVYKREYKSETYRIYLKDLTITSEKMSFLQNGIAFTREKNDCRIGSRIEVRGTCCAPETASNPGQFDQASYYLAQNVGLLLYEAKVTEESSSYSRLREAFACSAELIRDRLSKALLSLGEEDAGILSAMLLGDRQLLDEDTQELYKKGGISHIIAISGLHISMSGMALYQLCRMLFGGYGIPTVISAAIMTAYGAFTGGSASATRAVFMFILFLAAQMVGRVYDRWSALAFAGSCILLKNPLQLYQCGFQLSMLSVAGVEAGIGCKSAMQRLPDRERSGLLKGLEDKVSGYYASPLARWLVKKMKELADTLSMSLMIQLFTLPCILSWFSEIPLYGIFLNLVVIPLMPYVLAFGAAGMVGACLSVRLGMFLLAPAHYILKLYLVLCGMTEMLPFGSLVCGAPDTWIITLYYSGLFLLLFSGAGKRMSERIPERIQMILRMAGRFLLAAGIGCMLFPAFTNGGTVFSRNQLQLTFLDVGQGDGIFLRSAEGITWLIDGGSSTESAVGKYRIVPFLKHQGVHRLDYVLATHMDEDHISGIRELLQGEAGDISVGTLVLHESALEDKAGEELVVLAQKKGIPVKLLQQGSGFSCKNLKIACLWPRRESSYQEKNENSIVLRVTCGSFSALLTGDLEGEAEEELTALGFPLSAQVLKVGHHGSKYASSEAFLEQVSPVLAVLSYGAENRYGHPSPEAVERLENAGAVCLGTAQTGAITVKTDGKRIWVRTWQK